MSVLRCLGAAALAASFCLVGCVDAEPVEELDEVGVAFSPEGGNSSGGTNGCSSVAFDALQDDLANVTYVSLVKSGTMEVNGTIDSTLLQEADGPSLFSYAVKCGLTREPGQNAVTWYDQGTMKTFEGMGHLSTTAGWLTGGLGDDARGDLFACVIAHLNPYGLEVPIVLSGPNVSDDGLDHSDFDIEEALWLVEIDPTGARVYTAWPTPQFERLCAIDAGDALEQRVCGQNPMACNLQIGNSTDCVYDPVTEGYYCKGKPALMTRLKATGMSALHPGCAYTPPP